MKRSVQHMKSRRSDNTSVFDEQPGALEILQNIHATAADEAAQSALDVFAVVDMGPPAAGLAETGGPVEASIRIMKNLGIRACRIIYS